jgi:hypothetical protein
MTRIRGLMYRVYEDFFMRSRLDEYAQLLEGARLHSYQFTTVGDLAARDLREVGAARWCVLRHDIDTDPSTAREMWRLEASMGVTSTFFFRLRTADVRLMREVEDSGCEVGYHFEEVATLAKKEGIRSRSQMEELIPVAQRTFSSNLGLLRATTGIPIRAAASHGDFMNRRLGISNAALLADDRFRNSVGIDYEAYDSVFEARISSRHSDSIRPEYWSKASPGMAFESGEPVVYLLVHPRHWRASAWVNLRDDGLRAREAVEVVMRSRLPRKPGSGQSGENNL